MTQMPGELGKFIVFEGPSGAGKTTVRECVQERLESEGYAVTSLGEFSTTPFGDGLREYFNNLDSTEFPFLGEESEDRRVGLSAAMAQLTDVSLALEAEIRPALCENHFVLKDRFVLSSKVLEPLVYEQCYDDGERFEAVVEAFEESVPLRPDATIYLDVDRDERMRRLQEVGISDSYLDDEFKRIEDRFELADDAVVVSNDGRLEDTVEHVCRHLLDGR